MMLGMTQGGETMTVIDVTERLFAKRVLLGGIVISMLVVGFLLSFLISPRYRSTTKMVVAQSQNSSALSSLGSMAGNLGLDLGQGANSLDLFAEYVLSHDLLRQLVIEPVPLLDGGETTLLDQWGGDGDEEERFDQAVQRFEKYLQVHVSSAAGVLEVTVETFDPRSSAHLARRFVEELNEFNSELRRWSGLNRTETLLSRQDEVARQLQDAEKALTDFRMANLDVSHPRLQLQEMRLLRDVTVQSGILQSLRVQQEMARLEAQSGEPVLKVLQTAHPPLEHSWPRRGRIALIAALAAFVLSSYFIVAKTLLTRPGRSI